MRTPARLAALVTLSLAFVAAQAAEREPSVVQIGLTLLANKKVQTELAMDYSQRTLIDSEFRAYVSQTQALFPPGLTKAQVAAKLPKLRALQDSISDKVLGALRTFQIARFRQIVLQGEGIWAVLIPEVSRELKLSGTQKSRVKALRAGVGKRIEDLQAKRKAEIEAIPAPKDAKDKTAVETYRKAVLAVIGRNRQVDQRNLREWGRRAVADATAVLTAGQRAAWSKMLGPKFVPK